MSRIDGEGVRSMKEVPMQIRKHRTAILMAAGALVLGAVTVAAPAFAGAGPFDGPTVAASQLGLGWHGGGWGPGSGDGMDPGAGMGPGTGMGAAAHDGTCQGLTNVPSGTLSEPQKTNLVAMAQEEKLAHDLYVAFGEKYPAVIFDRIAASETQHLTVVRTLLSRYSLTDPTANMAAGKFSDPTVQATYDRLLALGSVDVSAALKVGQQVERTDIADLRAALAGLTAPDVEQVYTHLLNASQHHLAAFERWSTR
jgi:hypothetical protein